MTLFEDLIAIKPVKGQEEDFRTKILNALLTTPHRDIAPFVPLFKHVHDEDPLFFARLGIWYLRNGTVRDLKHLFVAMLCTSKFDVDFREAGLASLMGLAPYEVDGVLDILKGYKERPAKGSKEQGKWVNGIVKNVPRSFKSAVEDYLRERENSPEWFKSVVMRNRNDLKRLYASLRIHPGELAQKVLFDKERPEGFDILKQIEDTNDPNEQAKLIIKHKIPYTVAVGMIKVMSPSVIVALVNSMSSQELINNLASLKERGAFDNPDIKALIEKKLESATIDGKGVQALKTRTAVEKAGLSQEMTQKVKDVGDAKVKSMGSIRKSTALLIDKSGSMGMAIEIGKQLAALIAPICSGGLHVFAFDSMPYELTTRGNMTMSAWEDAFKGIKAGGNTYAATPILAMARKNQVVEQIIYVTDEGENGTPTSGVALRAYAESFKIEPTVVIVKVGTASDQMEKSFKHAGFNVETFSPSSNKSDYYSLPSLIPMLSKGSRLELLMDIMSLDLPMRKKVVAKQLALV